MAFTKEATRVPQRIAAIEVTLYSPDPLGTESPGASYSVQVMYSTGEVRALTGDLVPHLTPAQITSLQSFMAAMRTKAVAEILP